MAKEPKKLDELFHDTLKDIYFAEKKILAALPKMAKAAQDQKLEAAFEKHPIDAKPQGKTCHAIIGIVEEGQEIAKEYKGCPCRKLGPHILMMQSSQDGAAEYAANGLDSAWDRRILVQG